MNEWFLSSAMTTAAVLGIRWLVKDRVSCRLRYGLWLMVLLRMLIPVNLARSSVSMSLLLPPKTPAGVPKLPMQIVRTLPSGAAEPAASGNLWPHLWLVGAAAVLGVFAVSRLYLEIRLRRDRVLQEDACCPVPVYQTAVVKAPCQVGLFRPVVYVTEAAAGRGALRYVLLHEMTHLRHFDHLWSVLRCVAVALHWFDPLAWVAAWLSKEDGELACDEGVLADLSRDEAIDYGTTLIQLSCNRQGGMMMGMNCMLNRKNALLRRVEAIAGRKRNRRSAVAMAAVLCLMTAGCAFTDAPERTLPEERIPVQSESMEPQIQNFQQDDDVWETVTEHILTGQEDEMLNSIPGFAAGEDWAEGFRENVNRNLDYMHTAYDAENAGLVFVKEIADERAEAGVRVYEIRYHADQGGECMERSDYIIVAENTKAWTSDLDCCSISGVFNVNAG